MLVNATEMLIKARDGHYGVPQFNINNLEWTKAVLTACEEMKSPVILGVSEGAGKYMTGFKTVAAMVDAMVDSMGITVPVALHLDHGTYEGCKACVEAGFSSIMFDGSHYSIEENVEKTKELVALAHSKGMSIEAEVGSIGGVEDGVNALATIPACIAVPQAITWMRLQSFKIKSGIPSSVRSGSPLERRGRMVFFNASGCSWISFNIKCGKPFFIAASTFQFTSIISGSTRFNSIS